MNLPFTLYINDKPNFFVEKIWKGLLSNGLADENQLLTYQEKYKNLTTQIWNNDILLKPKIHTIRRGERWSTGMEIAPVVEGNNGQFEFTPKIICLSVQEIHVSYKKGFQVSIDGKILGQKELKKLVINDGFEDISEFKLYFNDEFSGQIVHWTNFNYGF